jgi:hypothetical protein
MKKLILLGCAAVIALVLLGCSAESKNSVSASAQAVAHGPSAATATTPVAATSPAPVAEAPIPMPISASAKVNNLAWHAENVKDHFGSSIGLKTTSQDGKYDLVIVLQGTRSFVSFARHSHWESAHDQPGNGKLMYLRLKFENGQEKHIEWDELGYATEDAHSVLWFYPARNDSHIGPTTESPDLAGGDQLLVQDMLQHKAMVLEVEPGKTTEFDLAGLNQEMEKARAPKTQPTLTAMQGTE